MSDVDNAQTGAEVAAVDNTAVEQESQTQAQTPTTEQVDTTKDDKPRDDKGRFVPQERVNEITRARREAERREQAQAQRADALEQELARYRQPAQHQPQSDEAPPSIVDFNYDQDRWAAAMTQYAVKQAERNVSQRFQQNDMQRHQQQLAEQFDERSREYAAANPGFEDRLADFGRNVQFNPYVVEVIGYSEHGPAVVDYLAQHLDEADRIARLQPHLAALHLGRIEAKVSAPKPKPVTNAPNPPPTLSGGKATVTKNPDEMTQAEWLAWRNTSLK